jgi:ABC-type transport system involved in cytochrome c biogenesis ATPase subunit
VTLSDEVCDWLSDQRPWQQDLARRLTTAVGLDADERGVALEVVRASFGIATVGDVPEPQLFERDHLSPATQGPTPKLVGFGRLRGVGLVVEDDELTFAREGLTLVFGQNATGKSSYVRGLKALCRTVDRDCRVRGNIYAEAVEAPSGHLEVELDGEVESRRTPLGGPGVMQIPGLAVFDTACAELYVDAQNTIQYVPSELLLLTRLAAEQDQMRRLIDSERAGLRASAPPSSDLPEGTEAATGVARLRGVESDPDLDVLASLTEAETSRLATLRAAVAAADASTSRADALAAQNDAKDANDLADALYALARRADETAAERLRNVATADLTAREALRLVNEQFATAVFPGIGEAAWRTLWEAARQFVGGGGGVFPPESGAPCPICLRPLDGAAAERLAQFERHVTSTVQSQAAEARAALALALENSDPARAADARTTFLAGLHAREPELAEQVDSGITAVATHLEGMKADPAGATPVADAHSEATAALRAWAETRATHGSSLRATEDPQALETMRRELAELAARLLLSQRLDEFREWQGRLRLAAALDEVHTALATNRITTKQRQLADSELSAKLRKALAEELTRLRCDHLPVDVDMHTVRAQTTVGLRLLAPQAAELSDIVSEGERRAVALAFFFAELDVADDDAGVIIDDPVSSLDDDRSRYIADRLVDEARSRQIIVFTHNLPFLIDLQGQAETSDIPVQVHGVWRLGQDVGRVDDEPPFKVM